MEISNQQLIASVEALNQLLQLSLPAKAAFRVARLVKQINEPLQTYNEVLKQLQEQYVSKDEDGNAVTLPHPNNPEVRQLVFEGEAQEAYHKAAKELQETTVDLSITPLNIEDLGDIEVKPGLLFDLDWLFLE